METSLEKKSLVAKLAEACNAVKGVEKKGTNQKQNYKYLKAADVAKAIRHEFFERNILVTFDEKEFSQLRSIKTNSGGEMGEFLLKAEVTFHDGDSAEKLGPFGAFGVAMDTGDKAIWKAKTGALKYVLRGIGLIPDEKDDPEADEKVDKELDGTRYEEEFDQRTADQIRVKPFQVQAFLKTCTENGKTIAQIASYLKARFKVLQVEELTKADFNEAIKWAAKNGDPANLESTLEMSKLDALDKKARKPAPPTGKQVDFNPPFRDAQ